MNKIKLVFLSLSFVLICYIFAYYYVKYTHFLVVRPTSFISSIFLKSERVEVVYFYNKNQIDIFLYNTFFPLSKLEKGFNDDFIYELSPTEVVRQ